MTRDLSTRARPRTMRVVAAATLAAALGSLLLGQGQVGSGHALDGSLEVGSYGFNGYSSRPSSLSMRNYAPYRGTSRQYLYSAGEVPASAATVASVTPFDTYLNDRQYSPAWSSGSNAYSTGPSSGGGNQNLRIDYRVGG